MHRWIEENLSMGMEQRIPLYLTHSNCLYRSFPGTRCDLEPFHVFIDEATPVLDIPQSPRPLLASEYASS